MNFNSIGCQDMKWIKVTQNCVLYRNLVLAMLHLRGLFAIVDTALGSRKT